MPILYVIIITILYEKHRIRGYSRLIIGLLHIFWSISVVLFGFYNFTITPLSYCSLPNPFIAVNSVIKILFIVFEKDKKISSNIFKL